MRNDSSPGRNGAPEEQEAAADRPAFPLRRLFPLLLLALLLVAFFASGLHRTFSIEAFLQERRALAEWVDAHYTRALFLMIALYTLLVALSIPLGLVLTLAAGFLFGALVGGLLAVLSATLGATLLFFLAKSALGGYLRFKAGSRLDYVREGFCQDAFSYILFLRLVPVVPFWLVNLAPAFFGVHALTFIAATGLGIVPATFVYAALGAGLDRAIAAQGGTAALDPSALLSPELAAGFAGLGLLALLPVAVKRLKRRARE